jgi:hypothetical protein
MNISYALLDFVKMTDSLDVRLTEAVEAGMQSGKIVGMLDAYDYLTKTGHAKAALALKKHLDDLYPAAPLAKA